MKRSKPSREVLAEAGIFNAVEFSRWAKSHNLIGIYLAFRRNLITNEQEWVVYDEKKKIHSVSAALYDKRIALNWASSWGAASFGVDTWGRIEGLSELFSYTTLKEFKNHYSDATIAKVS